MDILLLTPNSSEAQSFYRCAGISKDLQKQSGHNITVMQWDRPIDWSQISQYDIVMMQRPYSKEAVMLCNLIKMCGIKLWIDHDDNLLNIGAENKYYTMYNLPETKANIIKIVQLADVVSVTTVQLMDVYKEYCKNIVIIPNAFNDTLFKRVPQKRENIVFWRGSDSHIYNLMAYGQHINKAIEEFPEYKFRFMGFYPWMLSDKKEYLAGNDIILYHYMIQKMAPKIFHAPLVCDDFNAARSPISFIEGSFAGACCLIPHWWPVEGGIKYKDGKEYFENLSALCKGEVDTEKYSRIAWEFIEDCLFLTKINKLRVDLINSL